jgi:hypothetical protein
LTIRGREAFGVDTSTGDGARDVPGVPGVEPFLDKDLIESDDGVRGSAENRFKLLSVALNGLLLPLPLEGVRMSSTLRPLTVFGGGSGGEDSELTGEGV